MPPIADVTRDSLPTLDVWSQFFSDIDHRFSDIGHRCTHAPKPWLRSCSHTNDVPVIPVIPFMSGHQQRVREPLSRSWTTGWHAVGSVNVAKRGPS